MSFESKKSIKIFDTLSNQIQELKTLEKNILKIYVCGPTVYDRPHLGNARSIVIYDLFYRFFLQIFDKVIFVRNITDVDENQSNRQRAKYFNSRINAKNFTIFLCRYQRSQCFEANI